MCNGEFLHKDPDEALEFLNDLAEKSYTWIESVTDGTNRTQPTGVYHQEEDVNLKAKVDNLQRQIEALQSKNGIHVVAKVDRYSPCFVCGGVDHKPQDCETYSKIRWVYEE